MAAAIPSPGLGTNQSDVSLVDQGRCLECLTGLFLSHLLTRQQT